MRAAVTRSITGAFEENKDLASLDHHLNKLTAETLSALGIFRYRRKNKMAAKTPDFA